MEKLTHECFEAECTPLPGLSLACYAIERDLIEITAQAHLPEETPVGDWQLNVRPRFVPDFFYTPHLTPEEGYAVDQHVFRTPALMMGRGDTVMCLLPVMESAPGKPNRLYLDLNAPGAVMTAGISTTRTEEHVLYMKTAQAVLPRGPFVFRVRVMIQRGEAAGNPFRAVLRYWWTRYGQRAMEALPPLRNMAAYIRHTYTWAFDSWKEQVWQAFDLDGVRVGAPQMIVTAYQSPNCPERRPVREPKAIWNQAWFCSLRSAQGVYRYALETGDASLLEKANMTKELALRFPQEDGLFDGVIGAGHPDAEGGDWSAYFFGNSNRNPVTWDLKASPRHILDMSWTALHMLTWYEELEQDERLLAYVQRYADRLVRLQDEAGFFPAWIDRDGMILPQLRQSPESAVSVTMLMKLYQLDGNGLWRRAALRCMKTLVENVMPESRWEDFETYWSCSRYGGEMLGKKFARNACFKQCSLSPFYMAQALLCCWRVTGEQAWLEAGARCLDEMLMYQSSFQPADLPTTVVGGFGVMNADAELLDARQSMFAETILQYGRALLCDEYTQRGLAALRASFSMIYCPENPAVREQWEKRWPFLNEKDYGFMMENYGHDGYASGDGLGIGEFTIYDWGNGAAAEAGMRIKSHFPKLWEAALKE